MDDPVYAISEKKRVHTMFFPESRNLFLWVENTYNKMVLCYTSSWRGVTDIDQDTDPQ